MCVITICQEAQVLIDDLQGDVQARGIIWQLIQLNREALLQRAAGHANGIKMLNQMEYSLDFLSFDLVMRRRCVNDLLDGGMQHAIVIETVDDAGGDELV